MARKAATLAEISPTDIIAHNNAISDEDYELFDTFPRHLETLERAIAQSVADLLPDELLVHETTRTHDNHTTALWLVLQPLNPATTQTGSEDADTHAHRITIAWLSDLTRVAENIALDDLVREAVRETELALAADA